MSLKEQTTSGVKWTSLSMIVVTAFHLATLAVLARFLDPDDFGLMAIMMVVIGFSQAFADMGISNAIIQRQDVNTSQLSSLYWLNVISGLVVTSTIALLAVPIAGFYERPEMEGLLALLALVFVIVALGNQYRILCQKEMQFKRLALGEMSAAFCAFGVAVWAAMQGMGVYALIYGAITQASVSSAYFLVTGLRHHHRPALHYKHKELKGFFSFGLFQMGEKSINYLSANADNLIIGKMLGMGPLGFYNLAWQLCLFPVQKINPVVNKVAFPLYSKLQNDPVELSKNYADFVRVISLITVPVLTFLFYFAAPAVELLFGEGWDQTAALIPILALIGILKTVGNPSGSLLLALGRADIGFYWNALWLVLLTITFIGVLSVMPSIENVAWALLWLVCCTSIVWHVIVAKVTKINYLPMLRHFARVILVSFSIGWFASIIAAQITFDHALWHLISGGVLCLIMYVPYLIFAEKFSFRMLYAKQEAA